VLPAIKKGDDDDDVDDDDDDDDDDVDDDYYYYVGTEGKSASSTAGLKPVSEEHASAWMGC